MLSLRRVVRERPAAPRIGGRQDDLVVTDCYAVLRVEEAHAREQRLRRHGGGLRPAGALVVGEHDDAVIADRHQAFPGRGDGNEQRVSGEPRGLRRQRRRLRSTRRSDQHQRGRESTYEQCREHKKGFLGGRARAASRA